MEWKKSESKQRPNLVDAGSCPGKVYVRKDIYEDHREDGIMYTYNEALMTQEEYQGYSGQKIEEAGTNNNQAIIMEALADIVDMLLDLQ